MGVSTCNREREWISLDVDGQLSEFERVLLAAHLHRCAGCRAFEGAVRGFTAALRVAPALPLRTPVVIAPPRFRAVRTRMLHAATAAAVLVAAVGGAASLPERTNADGTLERVLVGAPPAPPATNDLVVAVRLASLEEGTQAILPEVPGGIGAVKPPLTAWAS